MLQNFRDFANRKIVRFLFALFLVVPFGLFGIDYYFRSPVGGDTLVSVGSQRIGAAELDQAMRQQAEMYRQQFRGSFDPSIMDNPEIRRAVIDRLVNEKLLALGAQRAGIRVGDKQLAERISGEPFFQADGRFSRERYEQVARMQNLTPLGLDERLREDMRQQQFRGSIVETAIVPRATVDNFIRLSEQSREVSVVNLEVVTYFPKVQVKPEEVKAYYESHKADFTVPEQVRVDYLEVSLDSLTAQSSVPQDEVQRVYDENVKKGLYVQKEERKASHILVAVKPDAPEAERKAAAAKAEAIAERVRKNPASFAETAKKESQDPGSAVNGGDLGFFGRGAMVKPFEEAAFGAKKNDIVGPVASDFGYHVIRVTDIRPEKVKTFAEAAAEIEAQLKKQLAARRFAEVAETFSNVVYEQPDSLKPAADALKMNVQHSGWIQKTGAGAPPALSNPKVLAEIFSDNAIKAKRNTAAIEAGPSVLVAAHVVEHKDPELRPPAEVQAEIQRKLQRDEAGKLAKAEGEAKLKALQEGKDAGVAWPAPLAVSSQKPGGLLPPVIERVFRADATKLPAYVGVDTPVGYSLVKVTKVVEPEKIDEAKRDALAGRLRETVAAEELEATLSSLRGRVGVTVRKDALERKASGS